MIQDVQLNWLTRYRPIQKQLARLKGPVLDVGSGAVGIGLLYTEPFVGCDQVFERRPIRAMRAVMGSALHLPFADHQFEAVIASDVLEHIQADARAAAIGQLIRVSRKCVIIGVPCGPAAEWADRWLARWWTFLGKSLSAWLVEHQTFGVPECQDVECLLAQCSGATWTVLSNENIWMHVLFVAFDATRLGSKFNQLVWRWWPGLLNWVADMAEWGQRYRCIYVVERVDG